MLAVKNSIFWWTIRYDDDDDDNDDDDDDDDDDYDYVTTTNVTFQCLSIHFLFIYVLT
jgi:hypothetical protein